MDINIGISKEHRKAVANELNKLLSDEFVLYTKTRKFHWNVTGNSFHDLHLFFEGQYGELALMLDEVAERVRQIGHFALGSLSHFLKNTNLLEHLEDSADAETMVRALVDDHETIIRESRRMINDFNDKYKDAGNADFVTSIMERHEKMAWMLRSYLSHD